MVDEDPFPPVALVNIVAMDLKAILNEKKDEKFSPNVKIRKVWIPKQYLVHKDELAIKGKVSTCREKGNDGRYPYHLKQEIRKAKPPKKRMSFQKRDIFFHMERAGTLKGRKYLQGLLSLLLFHLDKSGMWCIIRNFLKSSPKLIKE